MYLIFCTKQIPFILKYYLFSLFHIRTYFFKLTIPKKKLRGLLLYLLVEICLSWLESRCFLFFSSFLWSFSEESCFASCPSLLSLSSRLFESFSLSFSALLKWPVWWTNTVNIITFNDDQQGAVMHLVESTTTDIYIYIIHIWYIWLLLKWLTEL